MRELKDREIEDASAQDCTSNALFVFVVALLLLSS